MEQRENFKNEKNALYVALSENEALETAILNNLLIKKNDVIKLLMSVMETVHNEISSKLNNAQDNQTQVFGLLSNLETVQLNIQENLRCLKEEQDKASKEELQAAAAAAETAAETNKRMAMIEENLNAVLKVKNMEIQSLQQKVDVLSQELSRTSAVLNNATDTISSSKTALNTANTELEETKLRLAEKEKHLEKSMEQLDDLGEEREVYYHFKESSDKDLLNGIISDAGYYPFIFSCCLEDSIDTIYNNMRIKARSGEIMEIEEIVLNCCIRLHNIAFSNNLSRQAVVPGDEYLMDFHLKRQEEPSTGHISRVLLQGIMKDDRNVFKNCRAIVEVTNE